MDGRGVLSVTTALADNCDFQIIGKPARIPDADVLFRSLKAELFSDTGRTRIRVRGRCISKILIFLDFSP